MSVRVAILAGFLLGFSMEPADGKSRYRKPRPDPASISIAIPRPKPQNTRIEDTWAVLSDSGTDLDSITPVRVRTIRINQNWLNVSHETPDEKGRTAALLLCGLGLCALISGRMLWRALTH